MECALVGTRLAVESVGARRLSGRRVAAAAHRPAGSALAAGRSATKHVWGDDGQQRVIWVTCTPAIPGAVISRVRVTRAPPVRAGARCSGHTQLARRAWHSGPRCGLLGKMIGSCWQLRPKPCTRLQPPGVVRPCHRISRFRRPRTPWDAVLAHSNPQATRTARLWRTRPARGTRAAAGLSDGGRARPMASSDGRRGCGPARSPGGPRNSPGRRDARPFGFFCIRGPTAGSNCWLAPTRADSALRPLLAPSPATPASPASPRAPRPAPASNPLSHAC